MTERLSLIRRGVPRRHSVIGLATCVLAGILLLAASICSQQRGSTPATPLGTILWEAANTSIKPQDAQIAILCLALATMMLVWRHARFRHSQYQRIAAAHRELQQMQAQLVQNEKLAAIGQLAAGVAHEMNTPLGFVTCNFDTLEGYMKKVLALLDVYDLLAWKVEFSDKEHRLETLETIHRLKHQTRFDLIRQDLESLFDDSREGLERVTEIIQSLRDFSRVDQVGDVATFNLNEGITATLTVARNELARHARVETDLGDIPQIVCNPGQINQVVLNVLVNAAQAIASQQRQEPGRIAIRTFAADGHVVCEIADDGPGIPADNLRRVFDPFFTTKPPGKGTGLGLSVSHDIVVSKHAGQFLVESREGQGTTFTIRLPQTPVRVPPKTLEPVS